MIATTYSDFTQIVVNGKTFIRVGSAQDWVAYIKAGFVVNSSLRAVKGNPPSLSLSMIVPRLSEYVAKIRTECAEDGLTEKDLVEYADNHSNFFQSRMSVAGTR